MINKNLLKKSLGFVSAIAVINNFNILRFSSIFAGAGQQYDYINSPGYTYPNYIYQDNIYQDNIYQDNIYQDNIYQDNIYQDNTYQDNIYQDNNDDCVMPSAPPMPEYNPKLERELDVEEDSEQDKSFWERYRKPLIGAGALALIAGAGLGAYFGIANQNQPEELDPAPEIKANGALTGQEYNFDRWSNEPLDFYSPTLDEYRAQDDRNKMQHFCQDIKNPESEKIWQDGFPEQDEQLGNLECWFKITKDEEDQTESAYKRVMVDYQRPEISFEHNFYSNTWPITITLKDTGGSGLAKLEVKKDDSDFYDISSDQASSWFESEPDIYIGTLEYITPAITESGSYTFRITNKMGITREKSVQVISNSDWENNKTWRDEFINDQLTENNGHMEIPYGVKIIPNSCFYQNKKLTSVDITDTVEVIYSIAFFGSNLQKIILPQNLSSIGGQVFSYTNIEEIYIPASVSKLEGSFYQCQQLKNINVDANNANYKSIDGVLYNKNITELIAYPIGNTKTDYVLPSSVTYIAEINSAPFYNCQFLENIYVEEGSVKFASIDGVLFTKDEMELVAYPVGNKRKEYHIPSTVNKIRNYAVIMCYNLEYIYIPSSVQEMLIYSFYHVSSSLHVDIPKHLCYENINSYFINCQNINCYE